MSKPSSALFQGNQIRRHWDNEKELWYFSVVDVIAALTGSTIPRRYWSDLKIKLQNEGSQLYDKIVQLKMQAVDGKYYLTDVADTEIMLRIIQSIPSPKAEPLKLWLARVGGTVAGNARKEIESKTGTNVITGNNAKRLKLIKKM